MKFSKILLMSLLFALTLTINLEASSDVESPVQVEYSYDFESQPNYLAQADEGGGVNTQDIAEIIETYVQPAIEEIKKGLENAPSSDAPTGQKVNYWIMFAITFGALILAMFAGGGNGNMFKNLKTS